jgi:hypothetical protein
MEASNGNRFQSVAWVLKGMTGSESAGLLRQGDGRLTLVGDIRKGRAAGKEWKRLLA